MSLIDDRCAIASGHFNLWLIKGRAGLDPIVSNIRQGGTHESIAICAVIFLVLVACCFPLFAQGVDTAGPGSFATF
jgi:hypothetical protein